MHFHIQLQTNIAFLPNYEFVLAETRINWPLSADTDNCIKAKNRNVTVAPNLPDNVSPLQRSGWQCPRPPCLLFSCCNWCFSCLYNVQTAACTHCYCCCGFTMSTLTQLLVFQRINMCHDYPYMPKRTRPNRKLTEPANSSSAQMLVQTLPSVNLPSKTSHFNGCCRPVLLSKLSVCVCVRVDVKSQKLHLLGFSPLCMFIS